MGGKGKNNASRSNQITHYGVMGGLAPSTNIAQGVKRFRVRRARNKQTIPTMPIPGLQYMKEKDILSKNPAGSGGVGLSKVLVDRSMGPCNCGGGNPTMPAVALGEELGEELGETSCAGDWKDAFHYCNPPDIIRVTIPNKITNGQMTVYPDTQNAGQREWGDKAYGDADGYSLTLNMCDPAPWSLSIYKKLWATGEWNADATIKWTLATQEEGAVKKNCTAIPGTAGSDKWCNDNCNHDPVFCPPTLCACDTPPTPPAPPAPHAVPTISGCYPDTSPAIVPGTKGLYIWDDPPEKIQVKFPAQTGTNWNTFELHESGEHRTWKEDGPQERFVIWQLCDASKSEWIIPSDGQGSAWYGHTRTNGVVMWDKERGQYGVPEMRQYQE